MMKEKKKIERLYEQIYWLQLASVFGDYEDARRILDDIEICLDDLEGIEEEAND